MLTGAGDLVSFLGLGTSFNRKIILIMNIIPTMIGMRFFCGYFFSDFLKFSRIFLRSLFLVVFFLEAMRGIIVELEKMRDVKRKNLVRLGIYYIYLLLVWGSFRYFVRLPEVIEELWFKPVIWLIPFFWWRMSLNGKPDLFKGKIYLSGGLGLLVGGLYFGLLKGLGFVEQISWSFDVLGIALVTAVIEELTFSGLVLGLLDWVRGKKIFNLLLVGLMVVGVHLPINIFVFKMQGTELLGVMVWLLSMAIVNGWIRQRTGNVVGSIIARFVLIFSVLL